MKMGRCRNFIALGSYLPKLQYKPSHKSRTTWHTNFASIQQPKKGFATQNQQSAFSGTNTTTPLKSSGFLYHSLRGFKWMAVPFGFGIVYLTYLRYCYTSKRKKAKLTSSLDPSEYLASDFEILLYRMLPLKTMSRLVGWLSELSIPIWLRSFLLGAFARHYGCNLQEAAEQDLSCYSCLGEFFRRPLKPGIRDVCSGDCLVSPADGTVLHFGPILNGQIEQVKDITYSLPTFLGAWPSHDKMQNIHGTEKDYVDNVLRKNEDNRLYQCVIYLAPGDYHRFHSPADWTVQHRRHFPGDLLSVNPGFVGWIAGLFALNERVAYFGTWQHGFFSLVAVGATSVGSVRVYFDEDLTTNRRKLKVGAYQSKTLLTNNNEGFALQKGDPFGEFNFGSTIVLIMEAPKNFQFQVNPNQQIKYGQLLGQLYTQQDGSR